MKRILIVEDDPVAGLMFQRSLEKHGFAADLATDGAQGLERLAAGQPDAVLLDVMMPKVDGITMLKMIRSTPALGRLPVVVMTNACVPAFVQQAIEAGADHVVDKSQITPLEIAELLRAAIRTGAESKLAARP